MSRNMKDVCGTDRLSGRLVQDVFWKSFYWNRQRVHVSLWWKGLREMSRRSIFSPAACILRMRSGCCNNPIRKPDRAESQRPWFVGGERQGHWDVQWSQNKPGLAPPMPSLPSRTPGYRPYKMLSGSQDRWNWEWEVWRSMLFSLLKEFSDITLLSLTILFMRTWYPLYINKNSRKTSASAPMNLEVLCKQVWQSGGKRVSRGPTNSAMVTKMLTRLWHLWRVLS
jgi:hypothetical protein